MIVLSIDIGIKNLGLCLLKTNNLNFEIVDWNIIDLCNKITKCQYCKKNAIFKKNEKFYCKKHVIYSDFKVSEIDLQLIHKQNVKSLLNLTNKYDIKITSEKKLLKDELIKIIKDYVYNNYLEQIIKVNANDINLIDIGRNLNIELNKFFEKIDIKTIDVVLLENQISPIANRMKTLQGMIAQYFIINNIMTIEFISSINKLKLFIDNKKTTYNERKKLSIEYTKEILIKYDLQNNLNFFLDNSKKDDLADSFLQGLYYLINNNTINLKN
tara:strand:- start:5942 stop:6751 length:810 start_codon:yes stop_codon:yes gene_type:complete